jgi:hypothetical protein
MRNGMLKSRCLPVKAWHRIRQLLKLCDMSAQQQHYLANMALCLLAGHGVAADRSSL